MGPSSRLAPYYGIVPFLEKALVFSSVYSEKNLPPWKRNEEGEIINNYIENAPQRKNDLLIKSKPRCSFYLGEFSGFFCEGGFDSITFYRGRGCFIYFSPAEFRISETAFLGWNFFIEFSFLFCFVSFFNLGGAFSFLKNSLEGFSAFGRDVFKGKYFDKKNNFFFLERVFICLFTFSAMGFSAFLRGGVFFLCGESFNFLYSGMDFFPWIKQNPTVGEIAIATVGDIFPVVF